MNRRYRPNNRNNSHTIPVIAIILVLVSLCCGAVWMWGGEVVHYVKGEVVYYADNTEANENLDSLMDSLSGDKDKLLEMAYNCDVRIGWVKNANSRLQFKWILVSRLIDKDLWKEASQILKDDERILSIVPEEGLERLAILAMRHKDLNSQLKFDDMLRSKILDQPGYTEMLLRSLRRSAQTLIRMQRTDDAVSVIACLDRADILGRLTDPKLAAEAADLQLIRHDVCVAKEPVLQCVRNILSNAKWPVCPATSRLLIEEVSGLMEEKKQLSQNELRNIEEKLLRCRDSMLEYPDREHRLTICYMLLGEVRARLNNYEGCTQALTLARAFAEGYGELDEEMQLKLCRMRSRANEARGALEETVEDCRYILAHDTKVEEQFRALSILAGQATGVEKVQLFTQAWGMLKDNPDLAKSSNVNCPQIATELSAYYRERQDYPNAIKWVGESVKLVQKSNPDVTDGKYFKARYDLAMLRRKNKEDKGAFDILTSVAREIEALDPDSREALDKAAPGLYINVMRERARTCLLMGDKDSAKAICKKVRIDLPDKVR